MTPRALVGSVSAGYRWVQRIPLVFLLDSPPQLLDHRKAGIAVGHDHGAVALQAVRHQIALKAPVAAAVHEVPALPLLLDLEADGIRTDTDGCHHLPDRRWRQHAIRLAVQ